MQELDDSPFLRPAGRYLLQVFVFCPIIMLAGLPLVSLLPFVGLSGEHPSYISFAGYEGIVYLFVGIAAGWLIARKVPAYPPTGRWIFVLPAIPFLYDAIGRVFNPQPVPWLPEEFFATGTNEGLGVVFLMLPGSIAVGYSIGMAFLGTKGRWERLTRLGRVPSSVAAATVGVAVFSILTFAAQRFERSHIEQWARIRTVIPRQGLSLASDANQLCTDYAFSGSVIPDGTMVEGLERRVCSDGRLLGRGSPRPERGWTVERVKVLTGASLGLQGWVLTYGLREEMER